MTSHHSPRATSIEWYTPPGILSALGPFDLDPCAPIVQPYPTAARTYTKNDDGLIQVWQGRVWLNPPYSSHVIGAWLSKMAYHNHGTALIFARTETKAFFEYVWNRAMGLLFMKGRVNFHLPDGSRAPKNSGAPTVLCAYGERDTDILSACEIEGKFVLLRIPRVLLTGFVEKDQGTWRQIIQEFFAHQEGEVELDELYRAFRGTPKAQRNPHYKEKIRQQLQLGDFRRVRPGVYCQKESV